MIRIVNSQWWQRKATWEWELGIAAWYLCLVYVLTTDFADTRHWVGQSFCTFGVVFTFTHMQVASRLEEAQDRSDEVTVECYAKLTRYLVIKELCWLGGFAALGAWTALAGIPLFLFYPYWRKKYLAARE